MSKVFKKNEFGKYEFASVTEYKSFLDYRPKQLDDFYYSGSVSEKLFYAKLFYLLKSYGKISLVKDWTVKKFAFMSDKSNNDLFACFASVIGEYGIKYVDVPFLVRSLTKRLTDLNYDFPIVVRSLVEFSKSGLQLNNEEKALISFVRGSTNFQLLEKSDPVKAKQIKELAEQCLTKESQVKRARKKQILQSRIEEFKQAISNNSFTLANQIMDSFKSFNKEYLILKAHYAKNWTLYIETKAKTEIKKSDEKLDTDLDLSILES